jgi:hypothetical protein
VDEWSEEQLDAWARVNITKGTMLQLDWHQRQVAIWARKVLKFSEKSAKILIDEEISGAALLTIPSLDALIKLYGVPAGPAGLLWAEIEKMKKSLAEPENKPTAHPALSIESQLQNLTLDALSES